MFQVRIGGLVFEAWPRDYNHAFVVQPEGLNGWYESVDVRVDAPARSLTHGDYDPPVFRGSRIITITGTALAASETDLLAMRDQLTGLLSAGSRDRLTVQDANGVKWADVRLSGTPKFTLKPSGREADFQIAFKAANPRKYGETRVVEGTPIWVENKGNFPASPVVEITGPQSNYTIYGPGGRNVQVLAALPAGQTDRYDSRTGKLTRNGVVMLATLGRNEPSVIPAGRRISMSTSATSMKVTVADTYI